MSIKPNNSAIVATCNQRMKALTKFVKAKTEMKINTQPMKLSDLLAVYQACIDTRSELVSKRAAFNKALVARESAEVTRQAIDQGLKAWIANEFGASSQEAEELGFLPPRVKAKTAATKAEAVEKSLATRQARGTKGKRQKEEITGATVAPAAPAAPAVTTPAVSPAASVPATTTTDAPSAPASPSNGVVASH